MNARTLVRLTVTNPASAVYLTLVGGSFVVVTAVVLFAPDPGFIGVWPVLLTAPTSLIAIAAGQALGLPRDVPLWLIGMGVVGSALIQSFALGALWEGLRGRLGGRGRLRRS
jgi:hypothetical protein